MLFTVSQKTLISTTTKNNIMAGIDDDLMDGNVSQQPIGNQGYHTQKEVTVKHVPTLDKKNVIDVVFRIIHYLLDAGMLVLSMYMMDMGKVYPLVFCVGLIIWLAYRILYFKRSMAIDIVVGLFLFVAAVFFYILAITEDYHEIVGRILIPTIYLGFFCVWGAIRRKQNGNESDDK